MQKLKLLSFMCFYLFIYVSLVTCLYCSPPCKDHCTLSYSLSGSCIIVIITILTGKITNVLFTALPCLKAEINTRADQKAPKRVDKIETKRTLLNILSWNIKGFREIIDRVKINKLKDQQFIHKIVDYDLVFVQETHLDKDKIGDIGLPGFAPGIHFLRPKRGKAQKASGGISVFVKTSLRSTVKILPQSNSDIVWTVIPNRCDRDTYTGSVYIPPENSSFGRDHTKDMWDSLERGIECFSVRGNVSVCGHFNARTGKLTDYIVMDNFNNQYPLPPNYSQD